MLPPPHCSTKPPSPTAPSGWSRPRARAGADAADAVAVRSMSLSIEVRDGAVEESERAEGDDLGLRVLVGKRQAVVSTNDTASDGSAALAERAVAMARAAPEDKFAGLADDGAAGARFPDLDLIDPDLPHGRASSKRCARARRSRRACRQRRRQVGRRLGLGRHRRHGAGDQPRLSRRLSRLQPRHVDDRRSPANGTGMERDYDYSSGGTPPIWMRRRRSAAAPASARSSGSIRAR